jgi:hypothetical protein
MAGGRGHGYAAEKFVGGFVAANEFSQGFTGEVAVALRGVEGVHGTQVIQRDGAGQGASVVDE